MSRQQSEIVTHEFFLNDKKKKIAKVYQVFAVFWATAIHHLTINHRASCFPLSYQVPLGFDGRYQLHILLFLF